MTRCTECKWCIGYDIMPDCYICNATNEIEYIEVETALNDDLGCDLFVNNRDDDATA